MASELASCMREVSQGGRALDLFSGMGSASLSLSADQDVTSVDVQEYSRVICSALLSEYPHNGASDQMFFERYQNHLKQLSTVYLPLIEYEKYAFARFLDGNGTALSKIIEYGCMLPEYRSAVPADLAETMSDVDTARTGCGLHDAIVRYYGGTYFSYRQAVSLAAARNSIAELPEEERDRFLAGILCSASHCGSTVGAQFAQPLRTIGPNGQLKIKALEKAVRQRQKDIGVYIQRSLEEVDRLRKPRTGNRVVRDECCHYLETSKEEVGAIYADPPYSRYHYSRYYHVLETIALGDEPRITLNPATKAPSRGVYREDRYQSSFSTKGGAFKSFERLMKACSNTAPALVLSYSPYPSDRPSTPRMVTIDELVTVADSIFTSVEVRNVDGVTHSKMAATHELMDAAENAEVLILCRL